MPRDPYAAHADFIAPAQDRGDLRLVVLGVLLVEVIYLASTYLMEPLLRLLPLIPADEVMYGTTPAGLRVQLFSFAALGLAVVIVARRLHGRGFLSLVGPAGLMLRQMIRVTLVAGAMVLAVQIVTLDPAMQDYAERRPLWPWLALLPLSLAAILVQTGAEELFYRGYVQQQLAARHPSPWVWMVLPNLLFAAAHYAPEMSYPEAVQYLIWAFFFGVAASDLTARSGTLGPAIGFHLVNNALVFLLYGEAQGPDSGLALFLFAPDPGMAVLPEAAFEEAPAIDYLFLSDLAGIVMLWAAARIAIWR
jgi:membrane protease YdiL (CAAX protease family)